MVRTRAGSAGFVGVEVEVKDNPFGLHVVNVYAVFDRPGEDVMVAVAGTPDQPLLVQVEGGVFYNNQAGGDTAPSEELVKYAEGCDVLIHEVYSEAGFQTRPPVWQKYHSKFHTSTIQLADIANRINPELLILYHQLPWGAKPEEMLAEIAETYKGKVVYGNDLDVW